MALVDELTVGVYAMWEGGRMDEATRLAVELAEMSETTESWVLAAWCHIDRKDSDRALEAAERAMRLAPGSPRRLRSLARLCC